MTWLWFGKNLTGGRGMCVRWIPNREAQEEMEAILTEVEEKYHNQQAAQCSKSAEIWDLECTNFSGYG